MVEYLRRRHDYLAVARGSSQPMPGIVVQARRRAQTGSPRFGFTVTKKTGNAVIRNRIKRRLREIARLAPDQWLLAGCDYVMIGRKAGLRRDFKALRQDFERALSLINRRIEHDLKSVQQVSGRGNPGANLTGRRFSDKSCDESIN